MGVFFRLGGPPCSGAAAPSPPRREVKAAGSSQRSFPWARPLSSPSCQRVRRDDGAFDFPAECELGCRSAGGGGGVPGSSVCVTPKKKGSVQGAVEPADPQTIDQRHCSHSSFLLRS